MHLKMSARWHSCCLGLDVLTLYMLIFFSFSLLTVSRTVVSCQSEQTRHLPGHRPLRGAEIMSPHNEGHRPAATHRNDGSHGLCSRRAHGPDSGERYTLESI